MPSQLLFVNKNADSASLTRSNAAEQTFINSHVQRGRRHRRSATSASRSGNRTRGTQGRDRSTISSDSDLPEPLDLDATIKAEPHPDEASHQTTLPTRLSPRSKTTGLPPPVKAVPKAKPKRKAPAIKVKKSPSRPTVQTKSILLNSPRTQTSPRDISQVTSSSLDPFNQSVVKLDSHVARLCRYFCENFHPSVWNSELWASRGGSYTHQASAIEVVRRAMQSEVEMNAMLACMAARIENVDMVPGQGTDRYMGNALKAVQKRFTSAPKHQLLLIVFHLYATDAYRQNYQAAKIHMQAAKVLFDFWGGLSSVPDPALKELFIIGDGHVSAILLEPCSLPCETDPGSYWTVTPPEMQLAPQEDLIGIAPSLQQLCDRGYLPEELVQAIQDTTECALILLCAPHGAPEASKHAARWLQRRHAAVRHRLLAMEYPGSSFDAIRVGLLMWILISMVVLGLKRLGGLIAPKLRNILWAVEEPHFQWEGLEQIKIWIFTVGAMSSVMGSDDERWFVQQLFDVGFVEHVQRIRETRLGAETIDVLEEFQANFFYYDTIQRVRLDRLARLISGGASETPSSASQSSPSDLSRKSRSPT